MAYNIRRYETLRRLGVEQLPDLCVEQTYDEITTPFRGQLPVRTTPVPGRRCPACMSRGQTVWVIPGKRCPQCGTEVN